MGGYDGNLNTKTFFIFAPMNKSKTNFWDVVIFAMEKGQLLPCTFALVVLILFLKMSQERVDNLIVALMSKWGVFFTVSIILAVIGWTLYFQQKRFYSKKFNELKNKNK